MGWSCLPILKSILLAIQLLFRRIQHLAFGMPQPQRYLAKAALYTLSFEILLDFIVYTLRRILLLLKYVSTLLRYSNIVLVFAFVVSLLPVSLVLCMFTTGRTKLAEMKECKTNKRVPVVEIRQSPRLRLSH
jgi:hypothetical protein